VSGRSDAERDTPGKLLTQVLRQSEHVHELIRQSAEELSAANTSLLHNLEDGAAPPEVRTALEENAAVTRKLQDAFDGLAAVNRALRFEIRDRTMVDHRLAAALEQEEGSRNAALHDNLTGLPNRVLFKDRLEHGIAQAKRHRWVLALIFLDLDNFKSINDTYGHQTGDAVLQTVAARLAENTRKDDTVSRYGGDEFLYLLTPILEQDDIAMIAAKILKAIQAPCDLRVANVRFNACLKASIGISVFPRDGASAAELISRADEAMYGAKRNKSGFAFAQ